VDVQLRFDLRSRNVFALLGLWTALASWLILIGTIVAIAGGAASDDSFRTLGWIVLGSGTTALILSVAGITMIHTRGESAVATASLVLTLSLALFGVAPLLLFGFDLS